MILHSKIAKITPKHPQITPDHTRSSQGRAFGTYFLTGPRQNSFLHCTVLHVSTRVEKQAMCVTNPNVEKFCHLARKNLLSVDRWINIEFNWICFIVLYFPFFCRILCKSHGWTHADRIYTAVKLWLLHSIPRLSNINSFQSWYLAQPIV